MNKREARKLIESKMGHRKCKKVEECVDCKVGPCIRHQYFPSFKPIEVDTLKVIVNKTRVNVKMEKVQEMQIEDSECEAPLSGIAKSAGHCQERVARAINVLIRQKLVEKKPGKNHPHYTATCESLRLYPDIKKPWSVAGRMKRHRARVKELQLQIQILTEKNQALQIERSN